MRTSELIKQLCDDQGISLAELARRTGQSRQNLYQKLKRESITLEELKILSKALGVEFSQSYVMPSGERIVINEQ